MLLRPLSVFVFAAVALTACTAGRSVGLAVESGGVTVSETSSALPASSEPTLASTESVALADGASAAWLIWSVVDGAADDGQVTGQVFRAEVTGGQRVPLGPRRTVIAGDFSDDGQVGAYLWQVKERGRSTYAFRLRVVSGDGPSVVVPATKVSGHPDVSADGRVVTFGRVNGSVQQYTLATGAVVTVCTACSGLPAKKKPEISNVVLSPDGQYVAIQAFGTGQSQVIGIRRTSDGGSVFQRRLAPGDDTMAWTTDSTEVGYVEYDAPEERWQVYRAGVDGTRTATGITAAWKDLLSGPMRLADTWYLVRGKYNQTSSGVYTTTSLAEPLTSVGTITTKTTSQRKAYLGYFAVSSSQPIPYQQ